MTQPPPQDPSQPPPADGSDEADHDAMEVAIGAAIAALIIAWLMPGFPSITGHQNKATWRNQVDAAIGYTVTAFAQRSASDLAAASGVPGAQASAAEATTAVLPKVLRLAEEWSNATYHHIAEQKLPESETRHAAEVAGSNIGRAIAATVKGEVRDAAAGRIGALWSGWKTRHDAKVRDTHRSLDNRWVPYGGLFVTETGAMLRMPGDPEAPLEETMGCRCHLVYRFRAPENNDTALAF